MRNHLQEKLDDVHHIGSAHTFERRRRNFDFARFVDGKRKTSGGADLVF